MIWKGSVWSARELGAFVNAVRSLHSWRAFWCVFSLVVRKVRYSAARNLSRGRKRKRYLFLPRLSFCAAVTLTFRTTKEKTHQKTARYAGYAVREWAEEGSDRKQDKYRDCTHLWKIAFPLLLFPRLPSGPTSIFASLALPFASLADFCILIRSDRENGKVVNCQLLLWHSPGELLTGNRSYLAFALQVLFTKGPNFIQCL